MAATASIPGSLAGAGSRKGEGNRHIMVFY